MYQIYICTAWTFSLNNALFGKQTSESASMCQEELAVDPRQADLIG